MEIDQKGWFYVKAGRREGPLSGDALRKALNTDEITPSTLVWTKGMAAWQEAKDSSLSEFVFGCPPPIPPPQAPQVAPSVMADQSAGTPPPIAITPEPISKPIEQPAKLPNGHWFDAKIRFWQIQRTISGALMLLFLASYSIAFETTRSQRDGGMTNLLALIAGCSLFVATRKLHVVGRYKKTGMENLHVKASLRSLASVGIYTVATGLVTALAGADFAYGIGSALALTLMAYILTIFSTYAAVRECRNEALFTP